MGASQKNDGPDAEGEAGNRTPPDQSPADDRSRARFFRRRRAVYWIQIAILPFSNGTVMDD
jgi:hypothetical protein